MKMRSIEYSYFNSYTHNNILEISIWGKKLLDFLTTILLFVIGVAFTILWAGASYSWPFGEEIWFYENAFKVSAARTILPIFLLLIRGDRTIRSFDRQLLIMTILAFGIIPLLVGLNAFDLNFFLIICAPQIANMLIIIAISRLSEKQFWNFVNGIAFVCFLFLTFGLYQNGLKTTIYNLTFGFRTRILFGFFHPIPASSAVLVVFIAMSRIVMKHRFFSLQDTKMYLFYLFCFLTIIALYYINSRNAIISIACGAFVYYMRRKYSKDLALGAILLIGFALVFIFSMPFFLSDQELYHTFSWEIGTGLYRLIEFRDNLSAIMDKPFLEILLPTNIFYNINSFNDTGIKLNFTDSVYLSYLGNLGLLAITMLLLCLLVLTKRLISDPELAFGLGALVSCFVFYFFDAQGMTTGNIIYLGMLCFAFRIALRRETVTPRMR